jgi:hypothetical protein
VVVSTGLIEHFEFFISLWVDFTKSCLRAAFGEKNRRSISPTFFAAKFAKDVTSNLSNLCAICQTPFTTKGFIFCERQSLAKNKGYQVDEINPGSS